MVNIDFVSAADILRTQADLRDRFRDNVFANAVAGQFEFINEWKLGAKSISEIMSKSVEYATAYRVEHQMTGPIMDRAHSLPEDIPVPAPPTEYGFVIFEKPIEITEMRNRQELIHALTWAPLNFKYTHDGGPGSGYIISAWNDVSREADEIYTESIANYTAEQIATHTHHVGRWSCTTIRPMVVNQPGNDWSIGPKYIQLPENKRQSCIADGYPDTLTETFNFIRIVSSIFESLSTPSPKSINRNASAELSRAERKLAKREVLAPEVVLVTLNPTYREVEVNRGTGVPIGVKYHVGVEGEDVAYYRTIHKGTPRERRVPVRPHWRGKPDAPESQRKTVKNLAY